MTVFGNIWGGGGVDLSGITDGSLPYVKDGELVESAYRWDADTTTGELYHSTQFDLLSNSDNIDDDKDYLVRIGARGGSSNAGYLKYDAYELEFIIGFNSDLIKLFSNNRVAIGYSAEQPPTSGLNLSSRSAVLDDIEPLLYLREHANGTAADGFGGAINWGLADADYSGGQIVTAGMDFARWTDAASKIAERGFAYFTDYIYTMKGSSNNDLTIYRLTPSLTDATEASYKSRLSVFVDDYAASREAIRIDADGTGVDVKIGDVAGANTTGIESDGTLTFNGDATVWDDQQVTLGAVGFGASAPTWTAYKGCEILTFANNQSNEITFTLQYSHKIKTGTTTELHVHTVAPDNNAGNVRWQLTVSYASIDGIFPTETTILATQTIAASSLDKHIVFEITDSFASSVGISGIAICSLTRLGSDGLDTYGNDVYLAALDSHYEIDTVGSRQEYTK